MSRHVSLNYLPCPILLLERFRFLYTDAEERRDTGWSPGPPPRPAGPLAVPQGPAPANACRWREEKPGHIQIRTPTGWAAGSNNCPAGQLRRKETCRPNPCVLQYAYCADSPTPAHASRSSPREF